MALRYHQSLVSKHRAGKNNKNLTCSGGSVILDGQRCTRGDAISVRRDKLSTMQQASICTWADCLRADNVESAHEGGKEGKGSEHSELHDEGVRRWGFLEERGEEETGWMRVFIRSGAKPPFHKRVAPVV